MLTKTAEGSVMCGNTTSTQWAKNKLQGLGKEVQPQILVKISLSP